MRKCPFLHIIFLFSHFPPLNLFTSSLFLENPAKKSESQGEKWSRMTVKWIVEWKKSEKEAKWSVKFFLMLIFPLPFVSLCFLNNDFRAFFQLSLFFLLFLSLLHQVARRKKMKTIYIELSFSFPLGVLFSVQVGNGVEFYAERCLRHEWNLSNSLMKRVRRETLWKVIKINKNRCFYDQFPAKTSGITTFVCTRFGKVYFDTFKFSIFW